MVYNQDDIDLVFESSKEKVTKFFQKISLEHAISDEQVEILINSVREVIYFLQMHRLDRVDTEIEYNKKRRNDLKDKLNRLKRFYPKNADLIDFIAPIYEKKRFHDIFQYRIRSLEKSLSDLKEESAGENKALLFALHPLFYQLEEFGIKRSKQVTIVYRLFKEFNFDDYGKEYKLDSERKKKIVFEDTYKERIRRHIQSPILKEIDKEKAFDKEKYSRLKELQKTDSWKKTRDLTLGRKKSK